MDVTASSTASEAQATLLVASLRPRTVGEVIDQAFRLYRRHFLVMLAIVAAGGVPVALLVDQLSTYVLDAGDFNIFTSGNAATSLQALLMYIPGAALVWAMLSSLAGGAVSFQAAYRPMLKSLRRVLGLLALQLIIWLVVYFPAVVLVVSGTGVGDFDSSPRSFTAAWSACLSLPYLILSIRLFLVLPALVAEDLGPVQALRRSWDLTRNYWWRTFALSFVMGLLSAVAVGGPSAIILALVASIFQTDIEVLTIATTATGIVFATLFAPVDILATGLYYFDQRVRKEGLDLETAISRRYPPVASYAYPAVAYAEPVEYAPYEESAAETPSQAAPVYRVRADRSPR